MVQAFQRPERAERRERCMVSHKPWHIVTVGGSRERESFTKSVLSHFHLYIRFLTLVFFSLSFG